MARTVYHLVLSKLKIGRVGNLFPFWEVHLRVPDNDHLLFQINPKTILGYIGSHHFFVNQSWKNENLT